jgi:hypothetical protein
MICPVEIARDMSALRAAVVGDHGEQGRWKSHWRESHKADFPSEFGNPAEYAGFPLSHRPGYGCCLTETGQIMCYEKRTF